MTGSASYYRLRWAQSWAGRRVSYVDMAEASYCVFRPHAPHVGDGIVGVFGTVACDRHGDCLHFLLALMISWAYISAFYSMSMTGVLCGYYFQCRLGVREGGCSTPGNPILYRNSNAIPIPFLPQGSCIRTLCTPYLI